MTKSEELVYKLCTKSFLSLWSYANPKGKKGKELCDILVVCDPDVLIFSVKEVEFKDTGDQVGWERWRKKAVEESCDQVYGAERWIASNTAVVTREGEAGLAFPEASGRRVHRVAVALGSKGKVPMHFGDFGKGFVHVLDEKSLDVLLGELDTISDFVQYLSDKESFYRAGKLTIFGGGGEEDLLALYLANNREFPEGPTVIVLDDDVWEGFNNSPQVKAKKQLDQVSYVWDEIIEELHQTYLQSNFITGVPYASHQLSDIEKAVRVMAREDRLSRRALAMSLVDFLQNSRSQKLKSRVASSLVQDVLYVFLISDYDADRQANMAELLGRCVVARGLTPDRTRVIGIGTEFSRHVEGSATTVCYLGVPEWTGEWQEKMDYLQREFRYFAQPRAKTFSGTEYPPEDNRIP